jgi:GTP-binding protein
VFISAVTGYGLEELKDVLWRELNAESNKLASVMAEDSLVHRDKDMTRFAEEMAYERQRVGGLWPGMGEDEDMEYIDAEDVEDLEDFEYEEDEDTELS